MPSLATLLSQALVAFTIELDNDFEHLMPHRVSTGPGLGAGPGRPWLTSYVMYANVLQYVDDGVGRADLHELARTTRDSLTALRRWRYLTADGETVRLTGAGREACGIWKPLAAQVEQRWGERLGATEMAELRTSLSAIVASLDIALPRYLPIVHPTQNGRTEAAAAGSPGDPRDSDLSVLLSQVLLAFTLDFERESRLSLPISANTLRLLSTEAILVRELVATSGVSREAQDMSLGFLARHDCAAIEPAPRPGRGKVARLTAKGEAAHRKYERVLAATERGWESQFTPAVVARLRSALTPIVGDVDLLAASPLRAGLDPHPDGWRARARKARVLPYYPMVLHRGGYPDGS